MRLIDADALRESIITRQTEMSYEDAWALTCVDNAPTIESRNGKWHGKGDSEGFGIFICDNCGKFAMMEYDFCPNCGADMRGESHEGSD